MSRDSIVIKKFNITESDTYQLEHRKWYRGIWQFSQFYGHSSFPHLNFQHLIQLIVLMAWPKFQYHSVINAIHLNFILCSCISLLLFLLLQNAILTHDHHQFEPNCPFLSNILIWLSWFFNFSFQTRTQK